MNDLNGHGQVTLVSLVANARLNVMESVHHAVDVFTLAQAATTVMEKAGRKESRGSRRRQTFLVTDQDDRTAEDLTVTQRKLALYEELLSDIFPLVPDTVRVMIDQARQQVGSTASARD